MPLGTAWTTDPWAVAFGPVLKSTVLMAAALPVVRA